MEGSVKRKYPKTYYDFKNCTTRVQIHQGGTRSGKTYSIIQGLIEFCYKNKNANATISICRKTGPSLTASVYRDFISILETEGLYDKNSLSLKRLEYRLFGNLIEFFSVDDAYKVRGRKRDVLFLNEANEMSLEDWRQLTLRTKYKIIIDYSRSDEYHWIYEEVIPRKDATFYKSTYLDNPFLDENTVKEIEQYKNIDENYWRVYGLGERGLSAAIIFEKFEITDQYDLVNFEEVFGLDFGYNHPTALVGVKKDDDYRNIYIKEFLYERFLTSDTLASRIAGKNLKIYSLFADGSRPEQIKALSDQGIYAGSADQSANSVYESILNLKKYNMYVDKDSVNLLKELRSYKWKVGKDGKKLDEPVKKNDHAIDAMRYASFNEVSNFKYQVI